MREDFFNTAKTLAEALPFLQRYDGAVIVIKLGGHAMIDIAALKSFARDVVLMKQCNVNPIIVHGGGPMINGYKKSNAENGRGGGPPPSRLTSGLSNYLELWN